MATSTMRKIDYLELMAFVRAKQDFTLRWLDRYWRMVRLYSGRIQLIQEQIAQIWGDEWQLPPDEETARRTVQVRLLEIDLEQYKTRRQRCRDRHNALIRYGQYFGQLPFRVLDNQPIPECFWYRVDPVRSS